jgi:hypothetical protein
VTRQPDPECLTPFDAAFSAITRTLRRMGATDVTVMWDGRFGGWRVAAVLDGQTRSACMADPAAGVAVLEAGATVIRMFLTTSPRRAA